MMSMESELDTDTVNGVNASKSCGGNDLLSESIVEQVSERVQVGIEEVVEQGARDELEAGISSERDFRSSVLTRCDRMENRSECSDLNRKTESVNRGFDLGAETLNVDAETNNKDEMIDGKESDELCGKLLADKKGKEGFDDAMEQETVHSNSSNPSDERETDVNLPRQDCSAHGNVNGDIDLDRSERKDMEVEDQDELATGSKEYKIEDENVPRDVNISDTDLVWAKVRSHPWWPGQKFDASDASEKAKKYFKKGTFLVTYFGDHTFAWNDPSRIKPFQQHFSQMEKQSNLIDFRHAIDCALEEVSRRIEFGLSCRCVSEEVYNKIKTQNVINPGIRDESSVREGGDRVSSGSFFKPEELIDYIKSVACSPSFGMTDKLNLVSHQARLLAFNRWKGYPNLPQFETLCGSVESAPKVPPPGVKKDLSQVNSNKRTMGEDNDSEDKTVCNIKEKTLKEFIDEKRSSKSKGKRSNDNSVNTQKKRKVKFSESGKSLVKRIEKNNLRMEDTTSQDSAKNDWNDINKPQKPKPVFGIGASILRVASQMNSSTPTILKPNSGSTPKNKNQRKGISTNPEDVNDSSEEQILFAADISTKGDNSTDVETVNSSDSTDSKGENGSMSIALILNFADLESVPPVEKLNKIFRRYGPLREEETQVMKRSKSAKVVFKRHEDAETAFSSAGKYSIFGPSLLSYRLKAN